MKYHPEIDGLRAAAVVPELCGVAGCRTLFDARTCRSSNVHAACYGKDAQLIKDLLDERVEATAARPPWFTFSIPPTIRVTASSDRTARPSWRTTSTTTMCGTREWHPSLTHLSVKSSANSRPITMVEGAGQ